ncbi:MAG TPA: DUF2213 domain-containing protein [Candidatus Limnocylindrales bacterium]|nr:DUF2213 domain-containing protein [Candidatus Limnocylindrales bacterium]
MPKLAYYASQIAPDKPHQFVTAEGYRLYTAVPICRTGSQQYLGRELKGHPDYDPAWGIADDEIVDVFRPLEVVTARETLASFEGKSVVDGHPPSDVGVVTAENEDEYGRGHAQNVRVGSVFADGEAEGETPLLADLWVKHQPLNDKIDGGTRDISCGYIFNMTRGEDGRLVMTKILGNHIAVVAKGRAGPEVAIQDSAAQIETQKIRPVPEKKEKPMKDNKSRWGRILKFLAATDAEPEDMETVAKAAKDADEEGQEKRPEPELHPKLMTACDDIAAIKEHLGVGKEKTPEAAVETTGDADVLDLESREQGATELPKQIADSAEFLTAVRPLVAAKKDKKITDLFNGQVKATKAATVAHDSAYAGLATPANPNPGQAAVDEVDPSTFFAGVPYAEGLRRLNEHKSKKGGK